MVNYPTIAEQFKEQANRRKKRILEDKEQIINLLEQIQVKGVSPDKITGDAPEPQIEHVEDEKEKTSPPPKRRMQRR